MQLELLKAAHSDLQHRGRDGIVRALRAEGKVWSNLDSDAAFFCRRCEECQGLTTRGLAAPAPRHLPRPLCAGEVLGVDLKLVRPFSGSPWVMIVLVDFTINRVWALPG